MTPPPLKKRPGNLPKLPLSVFSPPAEASPDPRSIRPSKIVLVLSAKASGLAGAKNVAQQVQEWKEEGFGGIDGRSKADVSAVVLALQGKDNAGEAVKSTLAAFADAPLSGIVFPAPTGEAPTPDVISNHAASLAPASNASFLKGFHCPFDSYFITSTGSLEKEKGIIDTFRWAGREKGWLVELGLIEYADGQRAGGEVKENLREALAEMLQKSSESQTANERDETTFVIDRIGSPNLTLPSSSILSSQTYSAYASFISHLALHPSVVLKLSDPRLRTLVSASGDGSGEKRTTLSPDDAMTRAGSRSRSASGSDGTLTAGGHINLIQASESTHSLYQPDEEDVPKTAMQPASFLDARERDELKRRLRPYLEVCLDAFGEDRLLFGAEMHEGENGGGGGSPRALDSTTRKEAEEWAEIVREVLVGLGIGQEGVDKIFATNAKRVYGV